MEVAIGQSLDAASSAQRLLNGTMSKDEYVRLLMQTYRYVSSTSRLLRRAAEKNAAPGQDPEFVDLLARKRTLADLHPSRVARRTLSLKAGRRHKAKRRK
jgi:hypothetical protein